MTGLRMILAGLLVAAVASFAPPQAKSLHATGNAFPAFSPPMTSTSTSTSTSTALHMSTIAPKLAIKATVAIATAALASTAAVKLVLDKPSRTYGTDTVAKE
jgi:hypothetical protein